MPHRQIILALSAFPFANHVRRLPQPLSGRELESTLTGGLSFGTARPVDLDGAVRGGLPDGRALRTTCCSRSDTCVRLSATTRGATASSLPATREPLGVNVNVSVNALGFAGYLLVKRPSELEAAVAEGTGQRAQGRRVHELQVAGGPEFDGDGDDVGPSKTI
ncbi:hypothetical protein BJV74DRAFT_988473 [Russula compacta]|nr:hypothetical protein BJV74DRAFT_988473 [Russula compacta]